MKENMSGEPLLFIESINEAVIPKNQELFDSRNKQTKIITKTHNTEFYIKLSRLVLMYNKNKKIICRVIMLSKDEHNVIIKKNMNNIIYCTNIENDEDVSLNINEIDEIIIDKID